MPEIPGVFITAAAIIAAILVYLLSWRATRSSSVLVKSAVRGGLLVLIALPMAGALLLSSGVHMEFQNVDSRLTADSPARAKKKARAARRAAKRKFAERTEAAREAAPPDDIYKPGSPPAAAGGGTSAAGKSRGGRAGTPPPWRGGGIGAGRGIAPMMGIPSPSLAPSLSVPAPKIVAPPLAPSLPVLPPVADVPPVAPAAAPPASAPKPVIMAQPSEAAPRVRSVPTPPPEALSAEETAPENAAAPMSAEADAHAASSDANEAFYVVPVYFGTDRQVQSDPKRLVYNSERGHRLKLGRALVTVPKSHNVPMIERPWALRIPYFDVTIYQEEEDPEKHFTIKDIKALTKEEFLKLVRKRLENSQRFKDHAILFVHGYNTSFDFALYRSAQISYDLKFDGASFVYSWPSGGAVASYTYDRESAGQARPYLREFLDLIVKQSGAKTISIIAHSMGNQPLLEVLKDFKSSAPEGLVISQIILAAPDVDADTFTNLAHRIEGLAKGVTLYAASNDRALIVSRSFWRNPRAGDVPASGPLIVPGIDTIDVTAASTDTFALNHSGYAENNELLADIGALIKKGLRPPDQRFDKLKRVTTDKGDYWRFTRAP